MKLVFIIESSALVHYPPEVPSFHRGHKVLPSDFISTIQPRSDLQLTDFELYPQTDKQTDYNIIILFLLGVWGGSRW